MLLAVLTHTFRPQPTQLGVKWVSAGAFPTPNHPAANTLLNKQASVMSHKALSW